MRRLPVRTKGAKDMTESIVEPRLTVRWSVPNQSIPRFWVSQAVELEQHTSRAFALWESRPPERSGIRFNLGNHGLNHARILPKDRVSVLGTSYPSCQTALRLGLYKIDSHCQSLFGERRISPIHPTPKGVGALGETSSWDWSPLDKETLRRRKHGLRS
jgi:hypothetical protein